ncbi:hypothetical protein EDD17DRAFT_285763 [Pisolithus thermaeus]|nr:hypothetical protein EDD17DRAFT_285763 [Pisolithus thermaeus]
MENIVFPSSTCPPKLNPNISGLTARRVAFCEWPDRIGSARHAMVEGSSNPMKTWGVGAFKGEFRRGGRNDQKFFGRRCGEVWLVCGQKMWWRPSTCTGTRTSDPQRNLIVTSLSMKGNCWKNTQRDRIHCGCEKTCLFVCQVHRQSRWHVRSSRGGLTPMHSCTSPTPSRISDVLNTPHLLLQHGLSRYSDIISLKRRRQNPEILGERYRTPQILRLP